MHEPVCLVYISRATFSHITMHVTSKFFKFPLLFTFYKWYFVFSASKNPFILKKQSCSRTSRNIKVRVHCPNVFFRIVHIKVSKTINIDGLGSSKCRASQFSLYYMVIPLVYRSLYMSYIIHTVFYTLIMCCLIYYFTLRS